MSSVEQEKTVRWELRLLGGFELRAQPEGERISLSGKRDRVLLAYLALSPSGRASRRKLAALLWGEADDAAQDNLRVRIWSLRKALGDTPHRIVVSEDDDIVLDPAAFQVDVLLFRQLATSSVRVELEEAAKLYCGEFLDGLAIESDEFESWRREEAISCRDKVVDVLSRLMLQLSDLGETERVIDAGTRILRFDPFHEKALRRLMQVYVESGHRASAIQVYRTFVEGLRKELGAEPEAETRAVFEEISHWGGVSHSATTVPVGVRSVLVSGFGLANSSSASILPRRAQGGEDWEEGAAVGESIAHASAPSIVPPQRSAIAFNLLPRITRIATTHGLGWMLATSLATVLIGIFFLWQALAIRGGPTAQQDGTAISLAVLPFTNLSGDPTQEFFSDGITEEITAALARVPSLRVVGRTSSFQFKNKNEDLRAIGGKLSATHLIEGSVRKAGDRVRITAELIKSDNGTHLWTDSYDRELTDIFAIQEDIARAITAALRTTLSLKPGETLVNNRSIDVESYQQVLQARAQALRAGRANAPVRLAMLEPLVTRYPDYAPAWLELSKAYGSMIARTPVGEGRIRAYETYFPKMEAAAGEAMRLDPNSLDAIVQQGQVYGLLKKYALALDALSRALSLDPLNPGALNTSSDWLVLLGYVKAGLAMKQRLQAVEPFAPLYTAGLVSTLWLDGQNQSALELAGGQGGRDMAEIYASLGRYAEAADIVAHLRPPAFPLELTTEASRLLRTAPAKAQSPQSLPRLGDLGFIYLHIGTPERALEYYEDAIRVPFFNDPQRNSFFWHSTYAPVRKTARFKKFVREAGFVDYWRARGWPDLCHPTIGDDFECN